MISSAVKKPLTCKEFHPSSTNKHTHGNRKNHPMGPEGG